MTIPLKSSLLLLSFTLTVSRLLPSPTPDAAASALYWKAACRGAQLYGAMRISEPQASLFLLPTSSPWDGDLKPSLSLWGYTEIERDQMCDFDQYWHLSFPFDVYGLDARPKSRGGPNTCYSIVHGNPWKRRSDGSTFPMKDQTYAINNKIYRVTGGFSTIGIDPTSGTVYFLARKSPAHAASELWNDRYPSPFELPAIRAQSDVAWGFWNRVMRDKGLGGIKAFWCVGVVGRETNTILRQAHASFDRGEGKGVPREVLVWPRVQFPIESVEGQAILGSPNGLAIGYLLAQHKRQLGGNKMVYRITVFKTRVEDFFPNIVLWVRDAPKGTAVEEKRLPLTSPYGS